MKTVKENSPLKDVWQDKKENNHSARKTVVKKLNSSRIPKCEIKNITGHSQLQIYRITPQALKMCSQDSFS